MKPRQLFLPLALAAILIAAWWAYLPGLRGGFLFDDFVNLPAIGAQGPINNWPGFWRYVTSGTADPTGRPLALLSFLADAQDWPADPMPFKRTSLILHLLNAVLIALLLRQIGRELRQISTNETPRWRADLAAVLGSAFWLLHPLLVSTTLYIVQREAMLCATFTLAGLLVWLRGRTLLHRGRIPSGLAWMALGLAGGTLLSMLSKANGILLPLLALVIDSTLPSLTDFPNRKSRQVYRISMYLLAGAPSLLVASYLLYVGWNGFIHGISAARPWTLGQRLLTEPRVLMEYLRLLWLPHPFTSGLFNDQVRVSVSLWSPATTLPAVLAMSALLAGAYRFRRRWPSIALAVLFFFAGQALESSTVALELYFEHRNYLPAMLLFWPFALWLCGVPLDSSVTRSGAALNGLNIRRYSLDALKAIFATGLLLALLMMTHARAELWGNMHDQALLWARINPDSARSQAYAAQAELAAGQPDRAATRLQGELNKSPDEVQLALNLVAARCQAGHLDTSTLNSAVRALQTTRDTGILLTNWFGRALDQSPTPPCPELNLATIGKLLNAAQSNPQLTDIPGRVQDLDFLWGRIALAEGQPEAALEKFNHALDQQVRISLALQQAALLGSAGYPAQGIAHLDYYQAERQREDPPGFGMPRIHAWVLDRQQYWDRELARLRNTLLADERSDHLTHR
ncbi:tetratricopeptide repeat protein [Dyella subtropica]|uniref:tetratricopeptide repeat protein n=1 Tax=Dyella subtropica TaxID=2992127 RepID=UPI00224CF2E8|nr:tetratricopeptide repeat protein [Dyella subtropica]